MARNRIIYASQSVWANGKVLYRVNSLGSTTTFTSEDIFELGHLDIVDIVDDVPSVAVTLNTNDFGDVRTLAILAQISPAKITMDADATPTTANLVSGSTYLHGVALADFAVTCGNLPGITMWAPVQAECDLGSLANNIDQTLFLDEVYVDNLELGFTINANATENYGAITDNKMWLLNSAAYVNYFDVTVSGTDVANQYLDFSTEGYDITTVIPNLSSGDYAFLRKTVEGSPAISLYDLSLNTKVNYQVSAGTTAVADIFVFNQADGKLYFPSTGGPLIEVGDTIELIYAADKYSTPMNNYFVMDSNTDVDSNIGALRQGQAEIYIIDGANSGVMWRLTACTITSAMARTLLNEIGHLGPYDRPLTLPVPITMTVDTTAGDLENFAVFAGVDFNTVEDIDLNALMSKKDLILMVKVFEQTDEEAGGNGAKRKVNIEKMVGYKPLVDGVYGTAYTIGAQERALKTIIVKHLIITSEGMTLNVGANATQTFGFRSTNDLFVVKGDLTPSLALGVGRNV